MPSIYQRRTISLRQSIPICTTSGHDRRAERGCPAIPAQTSPSQTMSGRASRRPHIHMPPATSGTNGVPPARNPIGAGYTPRLGHKCNANLPCAYTMVGRVRKFPAVNMGFLYNILSIDSEIRTTPQLVITSTVTGTVDLVDKNSSKSHVH